jgi:hypothetical protein
MEGSYDWANAGEAPIVTRVAKAKHLIIPHLLMSVTRVRPHDCGENYYLVLRGRAYEARHIERTISRQLISALNEAAHDGNTTRCAVDNLIAKASAGGVPAIKEMRRRRRW